MGNVLDLLVEYSKRGKLIDRIYMLKIIDVATKEKELDDYIKKVIFARFNVGHEQNIMLYESFGKVIKINESRISKICNASFENFQKIGLTTFEQYILLNARMLQGLLHEIEHANQHKKSKIDNKRFENMLLAICLHNENEYFNQSKIAQILMTTLGTCLDKNFYRNYVLNDALRKHFSTTLPEERLAEIHSINEIQNILKPIKSEIPKAFSLFDELLSISYLRGYKDQNYYDEILLSSEGYNSQNFNVGPTQRYLYNLKILGISGINSHFNENFYKAMSLVKESSVEDRLTFGMAITKEEYHKTKSILPTGLI